MNKQPSRRAFLQQTTLAGAGLITAGPLQLFSQTKKHTFMNVTIKSKGYAGFDKSGKIAPWNFDRRPVGDDDILIDVKFCGICHSDIHEIRGHWGDQTNPQVPRS
jgi:alcohol dehydrogenase (NADP+)/uncharacterized zinc-type alcohol dehydrogenase-like protein